MTLHPELKRLLPRGFMVGFDPELEADITAFALAVAKKERERCVEMLYAEENYLGSGTLRALPDPNWRIE